jgi:phage-related protein
MKYLGNMTVKLMVDNGFVEPEERSEMLDEFKVSIAKQQESKNSFLQKFNGVLSHPFGVLLSLLLYVKINRAINENNRNNEDDDFKYQFKQELKQQMIQDLKD